MESILSSIQHISRETTQEECKGNEKVLEEIKEVSRLLAHNERWFQLEEDKNLIEACIYQRESLRARYRYLLELARKQGVSAPPF